MWIAPQLQPILFLIPDARNKIIQLFDADLNFRSMCEDYWACVKVLEECSDHLVRDELLETEYRSIRALLENEVTEYLKRN